jgi:pimeloyl-ACP methyl ester carboxylesterase
VGAAIVVTAILQLHRIDAVSFYLWKHLSPSAHGGKYAEINGIKLYYETYGYGRSTLVLHGGLGTIEDMRHQIRALAATRFVIAPDSRAHGRSTDADVPLSYTLMASDVLQLLDQLCVNQVDVVGWSDGGIIALDLAMHHPERIGRLVAISANYDVKGIIESPPSAVESPHAPLFYRYTAPDPGHWPILYHKVVELWRTQPHYDLSDLHTIRASTLIMAGALDVVRREHTNSLAKAIPLAEEVILERATHNAVLEDPARVNKHIAEFLDR